MPKYNPEIRERMKKIGVSQVDVAIILGVHRVTIFDWMRVPLTAERRKKIEDALDVLEQEGAVD